MATKDLTIAKQLDEVTLSVIGEHNLQGFEKAYLIANATSKLKTLLTPEYMKPIMELQGTRLGFATDKIYPEQTVKNVLIEAVLTGLLPHGNQFNIIAGNMYPTKEGLGYLLDNFPGLKYRIIPELPRVNAAQTSAAIVMNIKWQLGNSKEEEKIEIPIKVNKYMGTDAIIGKATRKARAWLYSTITGNEITDGEVEDLDSPAHIQKTIVINAEEIAENKEYQRITDHINNAKTQKELQQVENFLVDGIHQELYQTKLKTFKK